MNAQVNGSASMDLSALDTAAMSNEGIDVRIYNPKTQAETGIVIHILGQDSDAFKGVQRLQQARSLNAALKTGPRREERMVDVSEDNVPELLAASTVSWSGMKKDGADFPCNKANALFVYTNYPIIRDQVLEAQRDRANFLKG